MKKKFLSNLALLILLNLLVKPFWFFGIEVAVQNRVGEEMYGFYFSLFNFAFILNILLDVGLNNFNNRAIARDHGLLDKHLSQIIPLKFMLSIIYGIVVFGAAAVIGYSALQFKLLIILVLNQFLSSFILYFRTNISGLQLFRTDSLLSVLDRTLMIIFNSILLWSSISKKQYQIEWFVYTQTLSYSITLLIVLSIVLKKAGKISLNFKFTAFHHLLRQSYPFAILILLMAFFNRADSVMIERLLPDGKEQAGIYAQSFRVLDALSQFAVLFAALLLPMFSRMLKKGESTGDLVRISFFLLMTVALSVSVAGYLFNKEIITVLYHVNEDIITVIHPERSITSADVFSLLMTGFIFIATGYIYGTLLTANRNLRQLNLLAGATVLINIILNLLLIPVYKAYGAAIASLASQAFYAISQVIATHRIIRPGIPVRSYLRILLFGLLLYIVGRLLHESLPWITAIFAFAASGLIIALVTGFIKPRELLNILIEKEEVSG